MIRENRLFCKLIRIKKSCLQLYEAEQSMQARWPGACPACGCHGRWAEHGWYERSLIDHIGGKTVYSKIKVRRVRCESCGHTHAILPDYIVPYCTYSLFFILRVLSEYFWKLRTVEELCRYFNITPSMLYHWKKLFSMDKDIWLGVLRSAEITPAGFIRGLITLRDYAASFGIPFFHTAARSFLQCHKDAAHYRHAVF